MTVYGKTMENSRNRIDIKLVHNEKDYLKCTSKPSYMLHKIFDENLVVIQKGKVSLKLNNHAYIGMCILELSKVLMYEYKDVLLNTKCLRHSISRIQSKDHRIGTYEMSKISLFCFDDKIYIQNKG